MTTLPDILMNGAAVYAEVQRLRNNNHRTSPENVQDVLDAIASLLRATEKQPKPSRIVCAACWWHYDGGVALGARHFDRLMLQAMKTNASFKEGYPCDQGFIDNHGVFLTRTEAWKVAEDAGQIIYRVGGDDKDGGTLFSENMY